mmetsp:Transcript_37419/g.63702  ORF Transcript_37419/g.63702 Transcript_37419/m.63702 type:complete len:308 (+) Transcript_37419:361-1284(+)
MHSSFVLGSGNLHKLFTNKAMASHRLLPPGGYFFTALANAANSSLVHGLDARDSFASRAFSAASFRAWLRCWMAWRDCRSAPAAVSTAHCLTSASASTQTEVLLPSSTASGPPRISLRDVNSITDSLSHNSSISSFIFSKSSQTASLPTELSLGLAAWYADMVNFRNNCFALRSCFFCCSLIFFASFFLDSSSAFFFAISASNFSLSALSLAALSASAFNFFSSFSLFSFAARSFSRFNLGSAAIARSTSKFTLAISSRFIFFTFRSISCFIHRFSSRQSALSTSCSASSAALRVKSRQESKWIQKS